MLVSFAMYPLDKGEHLSPYVARITRIINESGLPNQLTPMSTVVEGDWDEVFGLIKKCRDELAKDSHRISIKIWVDDKVGAKDQLKYKVESVEKKLKEAK
jgi:uncharacterized protein (TIGR00106 family)